MDTRTTEVVIFTFPDGRETALLPKHAITIGKNLVQEGRRILQDWDEDDREQPSH